jgi:hypothetical protein
VNRSRCHPITVRVSSRNTGSKEMQAGLGNRAEKLRSRPRAVGLQILIGASLRAREVSVPESS